MKTERMHGIDMVRVAAIAFVIVLHATSTSGGLDRPGTLTWLVLLYLRHLTLSAVPLFLMLSGYLQNRKTFSASYYRGILPLYLSYAVISALCLLANYVRGAETFDLVNAVYRIMNFSANGYAWYFEMYIGLFLWIPFLNMVYHGIRTRAGKHVLLLSLTVLTLLPDTIAGFAPYYDGSGSPVALNIFPDFFKSVYPFTYYFFGCYFSEFGPKLRGAKKLLGLLPPILPVALVSLYTQRRTAYAWYMCNGFQTVTVCLTALFVFAALYDLKVRPRFLQKGMEQIALCAFEMYLLSYLWDSLFYHTIVPDKQIPYAIATPLVFLCSFISAWILRLILRPACTWTAHIFDRLLNGKVGQL